MEDLIIVWDHGYEKKSELYPGYKKKDDVMSPAQRADFVAQFKLLDNFLLWLGIKCCYEEGFEADDVIAHLCFVQRILRSDGVQHQIKRPILIFSGDHDLYPLLAGDVAMWKQHKEILYTAETFQQEFPDLLPEQYQEMQALMGCSGDKVPGVRGIGPKRAADLIRRYGSAAGVRESGDGDRVVKLVQDNWDAVELSAKLVAFEPVSPVIMVEKPDLSRLRKHLFMLYMDGLIEDWVNVEALSKL